MAASCDFRFCTPRSEFRGPEVQLGAIAGSGGTSRLTRLIGPHWGKWMAMAGVPVGAGHAMSYFNAAAQSLHDAPAYLNTVLPGPQTGVKP